MKFEYITSKQNLKSDIHLQNNEKVLHVYLKILFSKGTYFLSQTLVLPI